MASSQVMTELYVPTLHLRGALSLIEDSGVTAYTVLAGTGCWQGEREPINIIRIVHDNGDPVVRKAITLCASALKRHGEQAVFVTAFPIGSSIL